MNTMARADGIKEEAEFTLSRVHPVAGGGAAPAVAVPTCCSSP